MAVPALEYRRKGWHMLSGVIITPMVLYTNLEYVSIVLAAAFVFILVAELLHITWNIHLPFWSGQIARTKRENEVFSTASLSFLLTIILLLWLTPLPVAFAAAAQLAMGDGSSALVGRAIGRTKLPYNKGKSLEGTLAGFVVGSLGAFFILWWASVTIGADYEPLQLWLVCVAGGFAGAVAETLPRLQDNVTVPVAAGITMTLVWTALTLDPTVGELFSRVF